MRRDITTRPIPPPRKVIMKPGMCNKRSSSKEPVASVAGNNPPYISPMPLSTNNAKPTRPHRLGYTPRWSPNAYAIMSDPKRRKFTFWIQPLGPAASADRMLRKAVIFSEQTVHQGNYSTDDGASDASEGQC
jgi:hypothetical protein